MSSEKKTKRWVAIRNVEGRDMSEVEYTNESSDIIWHYFPHEKPNFGDLILWSHYQAPSDPPEVIVFDRDIEWLDGDMWAKIK